jgi:hypothetical protein
MGVKKLSERSHLLSEINRIIENEGRIPSFSPANVVTSISPFETPPNSHLPCQSISTPLSLSKIHQTPSPTPAPPPLSLDRKRTSMFVNSGPLPSFHPSTTSSPSTASFHLGLEERTATPEFHRPHTTTDVTRRIVKTKVSPSLSFLRLTSRRPFFSLSVSNSVELSFAWKTAIHPRLTITEFR